MIFFCFKRFFFFLLLRLLLQSDLQYEKYGNQFVLGGWLKWSSVNLKTSNKAAQKLEMINFPSPLLNVQPFPRI